MEDVSYGNWARSECFKVEKGLLSYGWGRWTEIADQGQFKRGWREQDIEDCARVIVSVLPHKKILYYQTSFHDDFHANN